MEYKGQIWCDRCGKYCGPISDTGVHTCTPNPVIEQLRAELTEVKRQQEWLVKAHKQVLLKTNQASVYEISEAALAKVKL